MRAGQGKGGTRAIPLLRPWQELPQRKATVSRLGRPQGAGHSSPRGHAGARRGSWPLHQPVVAG